MSEARFTPGPWTWTRRENATGPVKGACVTICAGPPAFEEDDDNSICGIWGAVDESDEANARLISAAPELYEALMPLAAIPFEEFSDNDRRPDDTILMQWNSVPVTIGHVKAARAALAKAEGRS